MSDGFTKITEVWNDGFSFRTKWSLFRIRSSLAGYGATGFELLEAVWQKTRQGRPVKNNKYPRWKVVARLESLPTLREGGRVPLIDDNGNFPKLKKRK